MEGSKPKYGHGIAAWTAAEFIQDNPGCTYRQISRHLESCHLYGNWRIMFTPRKAKSRIFSTAMNLFWTRELGRSEDGSRRRVYRYRITPQGEEFASGPRPPTHAELAAEWRARRSRSRHPNDWVNTIQSHDLLLMRRDKRLSGFGMSGWRVGEEIIKDGRHNERAYVRIHADDMLIFLGLESAPMYNSDWQRPIYMGRVLVISSRTGETLAVRSELLKPAQRRQARKEAQ